MTVTSPRPACELEVIVVMQRAIVAQLEELGCECLAHELELASCRAAVAESEEELHLALRAEAVA